MYDNPTVIMAFDLYTLLARDGYTNKEHLQKYLANDQVRGLVDQFAERNDCVNLIAGENLYLIPKTKLSPFHVNNDWLKKNYLRGNATNADLYLMYLSTIILIGEFYNSYHSTEVTRNFIPMDEWVESVNKRIKTLDDHSEESLKSFEKEFSYNWTSLIEKWEGMDDLKETAKKQTGNTISRLSFLDTVKRFLLDQEIIVELGNNEINLSEKTKTIVQRFFMELDINRGIIEFLYQIDEKEEGEDNHAIDI